MIPSPVATESILMKLAQHGVSRQDAHEEIRVLVCHEVLDQFRENTNRP